MVISITAVLDRKHKAFSKALVRHSGALESLRNAIQYKGSELLPFDILQVVFIDRLSDYVHPVGCKGDRLFQVEMAMPEPEAVDYSNEGEFVSAIASKVIIAFGVSGLAGDQVCEIKDAIHDAIG